MKKFELKMGTHIIAKVNDIEEYLTKKEQEELYRLTNKVRDNRIRNGNPINYYYICNTDEPYAVDVLGVIRNGEMNK